MRQATQVRGPHLRLGSSSCPPLCGGAGIGVFRVPRDGARRKVSLVIRHVPAGMSLTACSEQSFVALLRNRQWHLALLFAHFAAMFEFGGNHVPALDTPEF